MMRPIGFAAETEMVIIFGNGLLYCLYLSSSSMVYSLLLVVSRSPLPILSRTRIVAGLGCSSFSALVPEVNMNLSFIL
jgi:hypothetical protein